MGIGSGIIIYVVLWVVMPYRPGEDERTALPPPSYG
jgi:phage shock protein PspC (stress-responsive transcriptional regulator)